MARSKDDHVRDASTGPITNLLLIATASRDATVELTPETVKVRLGLTWRSEFPRDSVVSAEHVERQTINTGAHGWGGRWLVNTSSSGLVRLILEPTVTARCLGIHHVLRELTVSLADPDGFLQELGPRRSA